MSLLGSNPLATEALRRTAMAEHDAALATSAAAERRAVLDEPDLRDFEQALYGEQAAPAEAAPIPRRSFLEGLFRRRR